jgi:hypothetical protein
MLIHVRPAPWQSFNVLNLCHDEEIKGENGDENGKRGRETSKEALGTGRKKQQEPRADHPMGPVVGVGGGRGGRTDGDDPMGPVPTTPKLTLGCHYDSAVKTRTTAQRRKLTITWTPPRKKNCVVSLISDLI